MVSLPYKLELVIVRIVAVILYISIGCYVAVCVYRVRSYNVRSTLASMRSRARRFIKFVRMGRHKKGRSPLDEETSNLVRHESVQTMSKFVNIGMHIMAPLQLMNSQYLVEARIWKSDPDPGDIADALRIVPILGAMFIYFFMLLFAVFPKLIETRLREGSFVLICSALSTRVLLCDDEVCTAIVIPSLYVPRMVLSLASGDMFITVAVNVAMFIVNVVSIWHNVGQGDALMRPFVSNLFQRELVTLAFVVCCAYSYNKWEWALARRVLEIKASSQAETIVRTLLAALCDADVILGPDLVITQPVPKLASLLHHGASPTSLQGTQFSQYFDSSDKESFLKFIHESQDSSIAQLLNSRMLDGSGGSFPVQLFHCSFRNLSNQVCHMIGIVKSPCSRAASPESNVHGKELHRSPSRESDLFSQGVSRRDDLQGWMAFDSIGSAPSTEVPGALPNHDSGRISSDSFSSVPHPSSGGSCGLSSVVPGLSTSASGCHKAFSDLGSLCELTCDVQAVNMYSGASDADSLCISTTTKTTHKEPIGPTSRTRRADAADSEADSEISFALSNATKVTQTGKTKSTIQQSVTRQQTRARTEMIEAGTQTESWPTQRPPLLPGSPGAADRGVSDAGGSLSPSGQSLRRSLSSRSVVRSSHGRSRDSSRSRSRTSSPSRSPNAELMLAQFVQTSRSTVRFSVGELLPQFNCRVDGKPCCSWHAAVHGVEHVLRAMKNDPCKANWSLYDSWQCPECTAMNKEEALSCEICGYSDVIAD